MAVWGATVWANGVWADGVWEGNVPGSGSGGGDSEQYGGKVIISAILAFPPRFRAAGARRGKPYNSDPDLDYER